MQGKNILSKFHFALFRFHYVPLEMMRLQPYKGFVLRGVFGSMLRSTVCTMGGNKTCEKCLLRDKCVYSKIFETLVPKDSIYFEGQSNAPHPFIIEPPDENKIEYSPQDKLSFNLVLIGKAMDFLPYFVFAFSELGRRGLGEKVNGRRGICALEKVESLKKFDDEQPKVIFFGSLSRFCDTYTVIRHEEIERWHSVREGMVTLDFITPTRVKSEGRLQDKIDFEVLIRSLLRRILALSYFHCDEKPDLDYKGLVEKAKKIEVVEDSLRWLDFSRYSSRQSARLFMGGFKGRISFEGEIGEFLPFILLGEYIHVGKGTAFGFGKYRVS